MSNASALVQRRPNENKLNYGKIQKKMTVRFQRLTDKDCPPPLSWEGGDRNPMHCRKQPTVGMKNSQLPE